MRRGAAPIGDRLDCPEVILASRASQEAAVSLEVRVEIFLALLVLLEVRAVLVALPDLNDRIAERFSPGVEEPATEVRDLADGGGDRVVDFQQVVVGVERKFLRKERPLVGGGGPGQLSAVPRRESTSLARAHRAAQYDRTS